jgi:hypothetical protein
VRFQIEDLLLNRWIRRFGPVVYLPPLPPTLTIWTQYGPSTPAHLREKSCSVDPLPPSYMSSGYQWVWPDIRKQTRRSAERHLPSTRVCESSRTLAPVYLHFLSRTWPACRDRLHLVRPQRGTTWWSCRGRPPCVSTIWTTRWFDVFDDSLHSPCQLVSTFSTHNAAFSHSTAHLPLRKLPVKCMYVAYNLH